MLALIHNCILCGSSKEMWRALFDLNKEQCLVKCARCGLVFNDRQETDIGAVYSDEYFIADEKKKTGGYFDYAVMERSLNKNYNFAYKFILRNCQDPRGHYRVLDIGCGYGFFLKQFNGDARFTLAGVEINRAAADKAKELSFEVRNLPFERYEDSNMCDFITGFECIEHMTDPLSFLKRVRTFLRPGGYALFTTPDIKNILFSILGRHWPAIHPSSHNFYFSSSTIAALASQCGFEVISVKRNQLLWSSGLQLRKRAGELFPFSKHFWDAFSYLDGLTLPYASGGTLHVILRKNGGAGS